MSNPSFKIRANYNDKTIRVYQAYNPAIAKAAVKAQTFVSPFKIDRMTWIKPSFYWMMYRSGFATKQDQEVILAIDMLREGFDWLLQNAVLSSYNPALHRTYEEWRQSLAESHVRVQWDPEKNWRLEPMPDVRSIQIGFTGPAVKLYVQEWIQGIEDITDMARTASEETRLSVEPFNSPAKLERDYPIAGITNRIILE